MAQQEDQFREFVAGFADPLLRLAFLLTAGTHLDASELTNSALAQVRREWREAETTGTPEAQAVEELVIALPRRGKERTEYTAAVPDDARALQTSTSDGRPTVPAAPPRSPFAPPAGSGFEAWRVTRPSRPGTVTTLPPSAAASWSITKAPTPRPSTFPATPARKK